MNKKPRLNQKPLKAYDVALYFLNMAKINQQSIDSLKIQKMLYYAQAESLVFCGKPLFKENIEAWDNGPMVYDVYRKFREYGYRLIDFKELKHFRPNKFSKRIRKCSPLFLKRPLVLQQLNWCIKPTAKHLGENIMKAQ